MKERTVRRYWRAFWDEDKMSRKCKLFILGRRMSKTALRRLLKSVRIIENKYPNPVTILPHPFCPKCGCVVTRSTGNMVEYPEIWAKDFCARCGFLVGMADNSPWMHALEFPEHQHEIG